MYRLTVTLDVFIANSESKLPELGHLGILMIARGKQWLATKIIPDAIPAVDCAVFFTYAPTAVVLGFVASFIGGVIGMFILGAAGAVLIAGIYGNATGGKKGAIIGAFVNGLLITFIPALLLPVLGNLGFQNTTFGDFDFGIIGLIIGKAYEWIGSGGVIGLVILLIAAAIIPSFMKTKSKVINNVDDNGEPM